jgi:hypothetical protein
MDISKVEPLDWGTEFVPWFSEVWQPGEHMAVIAPTGAGKTTFVRGLLDSRRYVLALDPKGGDSSLSKLGYPRLSSWSGDKAMGRIVEENDRKGLPSRFIVGSTGRTEGDQSKLRETLKGALDSAWTMGGWTVYADELQILTDRRMMNLQKECDKMLVAARDRGVSFISSYQAPAWVTPHASRQATWVAVSYTRDAAVVDRLAEILGRPKNEIRGALQGLERFSWLIVGRDPREPYRVTIPEL